MVTRMPEVIVTQQDLMGCSLIWTSSLIQAMLRLYWHTAGRIIQIPIYFLIMLHLTHTHTHTHTPTALSRIIIFICFDSWFDIATCVHVHVCTLLITIFWLGETLRRSSPDPYNLVLGFPQTRLHSSSVILKLATQPLSRSASRLNLAFKPSTVIWWSRSSQFKKITDLWNGCTR